MSAMLQHLRPKSEDSCHPLRCLAGTPHAVDVSAGREWLPPTCCLSFERPQFDRAGIIICQRDGAYVFRSPRLTCSSYLSSALQQHICASMLSKVSALPLRQCLVSLTRTPSRGLRRVVCRVQLTASLYRLRRVPWNAWSRDAPAWWPR